MNLHTIIRYLLWLALVICLTFITAAFTLAPSPITGTSTNVTEDDMMASVTHSAQLTDFVSQVRNGNAKSLVGVYIPDLMALPVVQQPDKNPSFVSSQADTLTQFGMASQYGTTGILAHNNLSGALFYQFKTGELIFLVYGDGSIKPFQVDTVQKYQALSPESPFSNFIAVDHPDKQISSTELFTRIYTGAEPLVFQTCLAENGNPSWGRIFITAKLYVNPQPAHTSESGSRIISFLKMFAQ